MDLKLSNIVISADSDAVLIDISGIGGVTRDWLLPEVQASNLLWKETFELRKQNDIWAFGKLPLMLANTTSPNMTEQQRLLLDFARKAATATLPRISLQDAMHELASTTQ